MPLVLIAVREDVQESLGFRSLSSNSSKSSNGVIFVEGDKSTIFCADYVSTICKCLQKACGVSVESKGHKKNR